MTGGHEQKDPFYMKSTTPNSALTEWSMFRYFLLPDVDWRHIWRCFSCRVFSIRWHVYQLWCDEYPLDKSRHNQQQKQMYNKYGIVVKWKHLDTGSNVQLWAQRVKACEYNACLHTHLSLGFKTLLCNLGCSVWFYLHFIINLLDFTHKNNNNNNNHSF